MPDARVRWVECHSEHGILPLSAEPHQGAPPVALIMLHCPNCDQHFRLSLMARENQGDMGWESLPCPDDPCPYAEAHKASHES